MQRRTFARTLTALAIAALAAAPGITEHGITNPLAWGPDYTHGRPGSGTVNVNNTTGSPAYLNAWIDFNNDGVFNDALITNGGGAGVLAADAALSNGGRCRSV